MLLVVGPLEFEASGPHFDKLRHAHEMTWAQHDRFGVAPHHQFTGPGPEDVEIDVDLECGAGFQPSAMIVDVPPSLPLS
jgi:phage protein U